MSYFLTYFHPPSSIQHLWSFDLEHARHGPQGMQDGVLDQHATFLLAHTTGFKKCSQKCTDLQSFEKKFC